VTITPDSSKHIYVAGPQVEIGSVATRYQRVITATDYDTAGFPHRLLFDGVDDFLQTAAIDFSATDAMTIVAGVTKRSDAAQGCVVELTASTASNNGAFLLAAPDGATDTFAFDSKGTAQTDAVVTGYAFVSAAVLTGQADISGDSATLRVNGVLGDTDTGDQGTGNYANAAVYIGRRGGTSLPFNGEISSLVIRGAATADPAPGESFAANLHGVTL
jgi:hypothetical protein